MRRASYILFTFIVIILLVALGIVWKVTYDNQWIDKSNIVLAIQTTILFINVLVSIIATGFMNRSTERMKINLTKSSSIDVETYKIEINSAATKAIEELKSKLSLSVNTSTENLKSELNKSLEQFKANLQQLTLKRYDGYHALWSTASQYFYALQDFEIGKYAEESIALADEACKAAFEKSLLVKPEDESAFQDFLQEATFLAEKGRQRKDFPQGLQSIWRGNGRELGLQLINLREKYSKSLLE